MKRLLNYTIILSLSLVVFGCGGENRETFVDTTKDKQEVETKSVNKQEIVMTSWVKIVNYIIENKIELEDDKGSGFGTDNHGNIIDGYKGETIFTFGVNSIDIKFNNFRTKSEIYRRSGIIEDLEIYDGCGLPECEGYYDMSLRGRWGNDIELNFSIKKSNEVSLHLYSNEIEWIHYRTWSLPNVQYILDEIENTKSLTGISSSPVTLDDL